MRKINIGLIAFLICFASAPAFSATGPNPTANNNASSMTGTSTDSMSGKTGSVSASQIPDLRSLDANNDGTISRNEFTANNQLTASLFNQIDTNNDGKISQAEFDAYKNAHGNASGTNTTATP